MAALLPSTNTLETVPTTDTLETFRDVVSAQGVDEQLVAACAQAVGRTLDDRLTPVQAAVWAVGFESDVVAIAPTGSGKTLAFLLPALVASPGAGAAPAAVALCPTRELALQTRDVAARAASALDGVAVAAVLCDDAAVSLARVALLALDECDRLLSPEFEVATARLVLGCRREAAPRLILATATLAASAKVRLLAPNATRVAVGAALGVGALSASLELRFAVVEGRGAARLKALLAALADDEPAPTPEGSSAPTPDDEPAPTPDDSPTPGLAERARRVAARPPRPPRPPSDGDETDDETRARRNRDRQREREKAKQQKQHAQQKKKGGRKRR
ncbi:DEAD box helicase-like protein [Aureococcus anophagefferens]|nr:DEAD box helicase-like protein [Aureococcus anophagefferens]